MFVADRVENLLHDQGWVAEGDRARKMRGLDDRRLWAVAEELAVSGRGQVLTGFDVRHTGRRPAVGGENHRPHEGDDHADDTDGGCPASSLFRGGRGGSGRHGLWDRSGRWRPRTCRTMLDALIRHVLSVRAGGARKDLIGAGFRTPSMPLSRRRTR
ncbi:hypothetical protein SDC9_106736 [bioreactor metagenome]|uniref:Uncharacterized protein n=1 Tax=bioreactor metagenome TaxID=1076179 RepID=A0A645B350_9ZZZZ